MSSLGIYLHWPFCGHKCPYCDFNSHVARGRVDHGMWEESLIRSIDRFASILGDRKVSSLFFGGGTPSRMPEGMVARLIDRIAGHWSLAKNAEITLEANPSQSGREKFQGLRRAGINRLSIGVQSLDESRLRFLGRRHSAADAERAVDRALSIFPRVSLDVIYGTPGQSVRSWEAELRQASELAGDHLSCYQLTIEPNTPFYRQWQRGRLTPITDDHAGRMYRLTDDWLTSSGWQGYEISNYARHGEASLHNLNYWRYGDYLGLGPGAHSRLRWRGKSLALQQKTDPGEWLKDMRGSRPGIGQRRILPPSESAAEMLMMGLRLKEGIDRGRFARRCGIDVARFVDPSALRNFQDRGWLRLDRKRLTASHPGRMLLDSLLCELLPDDEELPATPSAAPEQPAADQPAH